MNKDNILVGNIQRFCVNDGPGIRTTVFLKGCSLRCPWCSNPENIECTPQKYIENGVEKTFGKYYNTDELFKIIKKDEIYYDTDGGVTFSGGEPLLQSKNIKELLNKLKNNKINICFESCMNVSTDNLLEVIDYIDMFYVDVKILLKDAFKSKLNGNLDLYLNNIETLFKHNKSVVFRIPIVNDYTNTTKNIAEIINLLKKYKPVSVEIFSVHNLGEYKYKLLNKKYNKFNKISDKRLNDICNKVKKLDIDCSIIRI